MELVDTITQPLDYEDLFKTLPNASMSDRIKIAARFIASRGKRVTIRRVHDICGEYSFESIAKVLKKIKDEVRIWDSRPMSYAEEKNFNKIISDNLNAIDIEKMLAKPVIKRRLNELLVSVCREALRQARDAKPRR